MRIAMLTNNYKPYIGGVPVSIEHLAEALRARGHAVYVFAPSYDGQQEEEYVIRYPSFPVKIVGAPVPNVLTGLFLEKVRELQIDIIHVHHPAIVGNVALYIRKQLGIPVVFTYHTRYEEYLHYIPALKTIEKHTGIIQKYLRYFCNQCDLLLAPTPGIRDYLYEKEVEPAIGVMPTGIPDESFAPDRKNVEEIRRRYLCMPETGALADYLFCTVSRLAKEKNLMFQLEGLACLKKMLAEQGKTFRHLMIGDGPQREKLKERAEALGIWENLVFVGNIDNCRMRDYQGACDAFLFTSKSETQGIVLLEAMAVGNPVVAVEASGVCDIVQNGENGYMTPEHPSLWAEAIINLMADKKRLTEMRQVAKDTAYAYAQSEVARKAELYYLSTCMRGVEQPYQKERRPVLHKVPLWH